MVREKKAAAVGERNRDEDEGRKIKHSFWCSPKADAHLAKTPKTLARTGRFGTLAPVEGDEVLFAGEQAGDGGVDGEKRVLFAQLHGQDRGRPQGEGLRTRRDFAVSVDHLRLF